MTDNAIHAYTIPPHCECCGGPPPQTLVTEPGHRPTFLCHRCAYLEHAVPPPPGCMVLTPEGTRVTTTPSGWLHREPAR